MGKTPKHRIIRTLFIHRLLGKFANLFNSLKCVIFYVGFSTTILSTFHNLCGKSYRQELMFAVMSRMLFCKLVSPICSAFSIFSTE